MSTAAKQVFYSLKDKKGGDAITLVSRVKGREARRAMIGTQFGVAATIPRPTVEGRNSIQRRERCAAGLDASHEAPGAARAGLGDLEAEEAGYAPLGVLRGRLALPGAGKDGTVVGYVGRALKGETPALLFRNGVAPA